MLSKNFAHLVHLIYIQYFNYFPPAFRALLFLCSSQISGNGKEVSPQNVRATCLTFFLEKYAAHIGSYRFSHTFQNSELCGSIEKINSNMQIFLLSYNFHPELSSQGTPTKNSTVSKSEK